MTTDALEPSESAEASHTRGLYWLSVLALPVLTLLMFADVLLSSEKVLSDGTQDVVLQGLPWREFGFRHLREGHLPLWNPHIFLGMTFVGDMQSAMFYPPNWLSLFMPAGLATNWLFALHILLCGLFMQQWAARRGLHPLACVVAGALLMFCGPLFLRIRAGHVPPISTMPWVVLTFLAIDEVFKSKYLAGLLTGVGALAMSILAGHPQYFFCTVVAGGIYTCLRLSQSSRKWLVAAALVGMLAGGTMLAAVQLLPGVEASKESVRSAGLPYGFAATYSLPPESFISLVAPGFFGDCVHVSYWGRWNMWESSLFMGVTGLVLAAYGAICGAPRVRCFSITMVVILLLLALGAYTPLFPILYTFVPGFNQFRAMSRFAYPAAMFLCLLGGIGLDRMIREPRAVGRTAAVVAGIAVLCGIVAIGVHRSVAGDEPAGWWSKLVNGIDASGQLARAPQEYTNDAMRRFGEFAALGLSIASGTLVVAAVILAILRTRRTAVYAIAALAVVEVFVLAWLSRDTFALSQAYSANVDKFLAEHPGDYRIFNMLNPDAGMVNGANDVLGYDSMMPLRLAELIAVTQGREESALNVASHLVYPLGLYHPFYKALRFRYLVQRAGDKFHVQEFPDVLPQVQLVQDYRVIQNRDDILLALNDAAFDPGKTVILERLPGIECEQSATAGTVSVVESGTDRLLIKAETPAPAILLVTDGWSKNWVAHAVDGSKQYKVMPADYVLRAIPLEAGQHSICLEYRSDYFTIGKWISLVSVLIYGITVGVCMPWRASPGSRLKAPPVEPRDVP